MFATLAVLMALAIQQPQDENPSPFDAQARVTEAIAAVRPVAYRTGNVDWPVLEAELREMASGVADAADMLPIYRRLLKALGDNHSFVEAPRALLRAYRERHGRSFYDDAPPREPTSSFTDRDMVEHREIALDHGRSAQWIAVPKVFGADERAQAYAAHLFIATADAPPRNCGYIVDLRGNTGGNIWPMLTGLSGLLGDGPAGRETKADGSITVYAELKEGAAVIVEDGEFKGREIIRSAAWRPLPALMSAPVAVLMDDATASSGEGVAVAFRGRQNTRSFGQRSYGVSTANNGYMMSDDVNLVVTIGAMTDRDGVAYPNGLESDETVAFAATADGGDTQIEAARRWLAARPECAAAS